MFRKLFRRDYLNVLVVYNKIHKSNILEEKTDFVSNFRFIRIWGRVFSSFLLGPERNRDMPTSADLISRCSRACWPAKTPPPFADPPRFSDPPQFCQHFPTRHGSADAQYHPTRHGSASHIHMPTALFYWPVLQHNKTVLWVINRAKTIWNVHVRLHKGKWDEVTVTHGSYATGLFDNSRKGTKGSPRSRNKI